MFFGRRKKNNCGDSAIPAILLLNAAATAGDLAEVKRLVIDCGIDPNKGVNGRTPLREAAAWGHPEVVEFLLEHGADPNIQDNNGGTPLHVAAWNGHREVVELLLEHGANPNVQDDDGDTPLHLAAKNNYREVVELLLEHGADPNIRNNEGDTPLDYGSNCEEIIEEFMRGGTRTTVYE
jgi:cytohesin